MKGKTPKAPLDSALLVSRESLYLSVALEVALTVMPSPPRSGALHGLSRPLAFVVPAKGEDEKIR